MLERCGRVRRPVVKAAPRAPVVAKVTAVKQRTNTGGQVDNASLNMRKHLF